MINNEVSFSDSDSGDNQRVTSRQSRTTNPPQPLYPPQEQNRCAQPYPLQPPSYEEAIDVFGRTMSCDCCCCALVIGVLLAIYAYIGMIVGITGVAVCIINESEVNGLMTIFLAILGSSAVIIFAGAIVALVLLCSETAENDDDASANQETNP
nr:unnamed protein product [Spirometra erinaceieuropaei]